MDGGTLEDFALQVDYEAEVQNGQFDNLVAELNGEVYQELEPGEGTVTVNTGDLLNESGENELRIVGEVNGEQYTEDFTSQIEMPNGWRVDINMEQHLAGVDGDYDNELSHDDFPQEGALQEPDTHEQSLEQTGFENFEYEHKDGTTETYSDFISFLESNLSEEELQQARNADNLNEYAEIVQPHLIDVAVEVHGNDEGMSVWKYEMAADLEESYEELTDKEATTMASNIPHAHGTYAALDHMTGDFWLFYIPNSFRDEPQESSFADDGSHAARNFWHPIVRNYEDEEDQAWFNTENGYEAGKAETKGFISSVATFNALEDEAGEDEHHTDSYLIPIRENLESGNVDLEYFQKFFRQFQVSALASEAAPEGVNFVLSAPDDGDIDEAYLWMANPYHDEGMEGLLEGIYSPDVRHTNESVEQELAG